jgi:hypothetical protein
VVFLVFFRYNGVMDDAPERFRWHRLTPDRIVLGLLAVEVLLFFCEWFDWPHLNKGYPVLFAVTAVGVTFLIMLFWFLAALLVRLRFQFSLLSLLLLPVVVAIPADWLAAEMRAARKQREAIKAIWGDLDKANITYERWEHRYLDPPTPVWLRELLGSDFFDNVREVYLAITGTDADLKNLKAFPHLQGLDLDGAKITDAGLEHIKDLTQLRQLDLSRIEGITDSGLVHLKGLAHLEALNLSDNDFTDVGLRHLRGLKQLRQLRLERTKITDAGIEVLKGLTGLRSLFLSENRFDRELSLRQRIH